MNSIFLSTAFLYWKYIDLKGSRLKVEQSVPWRNPEKILSPDTFNVIVNVIVLYSSTPPAEPAHLTSSLPAWHVSWNFTSQQRDRQADVISNRNVIAVITIDASWTTAGFKTSTVHPLNNYINCTPMYQNWTRPHYKYGGKILFIFWTIICVHAIMNKSFFHYYSHQKVTKQVTRKHLLDREFWNKHIYQEWKIMCTFRNSAQKTFRNIKAQNRIEGREKRVWVLEWNPRFF